MRSLANLFKNKNKKTLWSVAAAGALALVTAGSLIIAAGPAFNIFPVAYDGSLNTDYPLLDARNVTKNGSWSTSQSMHNAGVNADPGDTVEFLVYYHNGVPDAPENTANNVVARATVPSASGNLFVVGAQISASNATTVSSSDPSRGGDMTVRISGAAQQTMTLVPGSTVWLPNRASSSQTMPDTIASTGVNLGSIQGCWQFSGFVKFRVLISSQQPNYNLSITKEVRKLTDTSFSKSVASAPGDTVEFRLTANNTGSAPITSVYLQDQLPSNLTFVPGTVVVSQTQLSGDLFSGGVNVGAVNNGANVVVRFQAQVGPDSAFPVGSTTLTNTGLVWGQTGSTSIPQKSDTATVVVTKSGPQICTVSIRATLNGAAFSGAMNFTVSGPTPITGSAAPADYANSTPGTYTPQFVSGGPASSTFSGVSPTSGSCVAGGSVTFTFAFTRNNVFNLTINKQVKNVTTGIGFAKSVNAAPSQVVEYNIVIQNTGNTTATGIVLRDVLPANITFNTGSMTVDGAAVGCPDCLFNLGGMGAGDLAVNAIHTLDFQATIAGQNAFSVGSVTLTNTGYVKAASVNEINSTADVIVTKQAPQKENGNPASRP